MTSYRSIKVQTTLCDSKKSINIKKTEYFAGGLA